MIVGVMQVELMIHDARTLKDKRRIVKSIKDRIANEFNVSIAEVDALDRHRKAVLGICMVANESDFVRQCFDTLLDRIRRSRGAVLVDHQIDLI